MLRTKPSINCKTICPAVKSAGINNYYPASQINIMYEKLISLSNDQTIYGCDQIRYYYSYTEKNYYSDNLTISQWVNIIMQVCKDDTM